MNKTRMFFCVLLIIGVAGVGYSLYYFNQYKIENKNLSIQSNLTEWLNRGNTEELNPNVIKVVQLGDSTSYIALFQLKNRNIGYAHLIKGLNGMLKISQAGHGDNVVKYQKIKTNKGTYGILVGENTDLNIDHITAKFINEEFSFTSYVSNNEKFVIYKKLPNDLTGNSPFELIFFDENNAEIQN